MRGRPTPAPRSGVLGAGQIDDAAGVVCAAPEYTTSALPSIAPICPQSVTWLRCRACQRGYFAVGAPGPQPCPACTGGRLQPVALWDLRMDPAPPRMLRLTQEVRV